MVCGRRRRSITAVHVDLQRTARAAAARQQRDAGAAAAVVLVNGIGFHGVGVSHALAHRQPAAHAVAGPVQGGGQKGSWRVLDYPHDFKSSHAV
jgi:hypothetical protein